MKCYLIKYWLHNQSKEFSFPQCCLARSEEEKNDIIRKCVKYGYEVEEVTRTDPGVTYNPYENMK